MAETYVCLAALPDLAAVSGINFNEKNQLVKSSKYSYRVDEIQKLMETTRRFVRDGRGDGGSANRDSPG